MKLDSDHWLVIGKSLIILFLTMTYNVHPKQHILLVFQNTCYFTCFYIHTFIVVLELISYYLRSKNNIQLNLSYKNIILASNMSGQNFSCHLTS